MDIDHATLIISTVANVASIAAYVEGRIKARNERAPTLEKKTKRTIFYSRSRIPFSTILRDIPRPSVIGGPGARILPGKKGQTLLPAC
jgi:hypothetical protein